MDFKYKTTFAIAKVQALTVQEGLKQSVASLAELSKYLPTDIDFDINSDLLGVSFNGAVANCVNLNDDGISGANLVEVGKYFKGKFIDVEHSRRKVIGYITNYAFTKFGSDEPLTEEEAKNSKEKFNITLGGVIWRLADSDLAEYIEECSNPDSSDFKSISASWEIGFSTNNILLLPKDKVDYSDGIFLAPEDPNYEKASKSLRSNGGSGVWDGFRVCRDIILPALPLGIGVTGNPAGAVKGIATNKSIPNSQDKPMINLASEEETQANESFSKVTYQNKELYNRVRKEADEKFGGDNSYVKNLWVLREYKKRGGKTKFSGKKPNSDEIKKSVKSEEIHSEMDEYDKDMEESEAAEKVNKTLNKPFRTPNGPKKFAVYVRNKKGNIVKVNFGDPNMSIKRDDPERRKSFRARHNCDEKKDKTTPGYWSCKMWSKKPVSDIT